MSRKRFTQTLIIYLLSIGSVYSQVNVGTPDNLSTGRVSPLNLPEELSLCGTEEGELGISGKFKEVRWSTGAKTSHINVQDTGLYRVSVFDGVEWIHDSIRVTRVPDLAYRPTATMVLCGGKMLRLTGNIHAKNWVWSSGSSKWGISVSEPGTYYVTSSNECFSVTDSFQVVRYSYPTVTANEVTTCQKNNIPLTAFGPATNYHWSNGQNTQTITVNNSGDYFVSFEVCDSILTQSFHVDIKAPSANPVYFPNVFTPNNDNTNDVFRMVGASDLITDFQISIFNRWGVLIYKSNDPFFEWNGLFNGTLVHDGIYYFGGGYRHNCTGEKYIPIEGSITIQR